jgi:hypothetical protein
LILASAASAAFLTASCSGVSVTNSWSNICRGERNTGRY